MYTDNPRYQEAEEYADKWLATHKNGGYTSIRDLTERLLYPRILHMVFETQNLPVLSTGNSAQVTAEKQCLEEFVKNEIYAGKGATFDSAFWKLWMRVEAEWSMVDEVRQSAIGDLYSRIARHFDGLSGREPRFQVVLVDDAKTEWTVVMGDFVLGVLIHEILQMRREAS